MRIFMVTAHWSSLIKLGLHRCYSTSTQVDQKLWTSQEVRSTFINYFKQRDHQYVHSSSVIPNKWAGLYFTNAGMNQFKPIFLSEVDPASDMANYKRVVNSQRCIRVGGKHNDLSEVGRDTSHHTLFEMLGSWSFGDYFKKEACSMAWDLLTNVYKLSPDRLYVTYFSGSKEMGLEPDHECKEIWLNLGVAPERVLPFDDDNFWDMGKTGPCGPCTEIHYDHTGYSVEDGAKRVNEGFVDVVELWNLVFMQYDRTEDGGLRSLPVHHVDTGMGLERLTAVLQGHTSNYMTDLFMPLFDTIHKHSIVNPYGDRFDPVMGHEIDTAYRIVADHARMMTVAIADGVVPGNGDRDKDLRTVMYEAISQAKDVLGTQPGLLSQLAVQVTDSLGGAFPEICHNIAGVREVIDFTEEQYLDGCQACVKSLRKALHQYGPVHILSGEQIHELVSGKFGQGVSLKILPGVAAYHGISLDLDSYHKITDQFQKAHIDPGLELIATESLHFNGDHIVSLHERNIPKTDDTHKYNWTANVDGYSFPVVSAKVVGIFNGSEFNTSASSTQALVGLLMDKTNFYAEKGGQVADQGYITNDSTGFRFRVLDVQHFQEYVLHIGTVESGTVEVNEDVELTIDAERRLGCMRNHTATHVLNHALSAVLGGYVTSVGSLVTPDRLTFDFRTMKTSIPEEDLMGIQLHLSECVKAELPVFKQELNLHEAKAIPGLRYIPDAVYPNDVRVVSLGLPVEEAAVAEAAEEFSHSIELCGGTHLDNTGHMGAAALTHFKGIRQGTKSVTILTGPLAKQAFADAEDLEQRLHELRTWIDQGINQEQWSQAAEHIRNVLDSGTSLPKVLRTKLMADLKLIMPDVNRKKVGRSKKEVIKQTLQEEKEEDRALITTLPFTQKHMMSALVECSFPDPVMILNKGEKSCYGVCYVPKLHQGSAQDWALHITQAMGGDGKPPRGKFSKDTTLYLFDVAPDKTLEEVIIHGRKYTYLYED